ncbi:hypothetical protein P2W50_00470 [Pseudomonas protegens]|uniref:hypothetical protein n=1 Tax=Pseudomonas protegens TaxID=380021 RepID=UPI0023EBD543|nr:hypothetical protein [Pseudomonas protegens]MDF4205064.1 hypothetical protein [Pseudomonas protegens]
MQFISKWLSSQAALARRLLSDAFHRCRASYRVIRQFGQLIATIDISQRKGLKMDDDWLIRELRKVFSQIDITAAQEADKEAKRVKKAERAARRAAKRKNPAKNSPPPVKERMVKCRDCGKPTKPDKELYFVPVQCDHCKELSEAVDLGIHPRKSVSFTSVHILQGGAPGLGKRK